MKVLFSADWHIKLGQKNVPKAWAINRYKLMFEGIHALEPLVQLHVIGGDLFDKMPSIEELELYFEFIVGCTVKTIIFAGNHESTTKHGTFFTQLKDVTSKLNKLVSIIDDYTSIANMDFIPYNKLKQFDPSKDEFTGNILFTHVRGEIPPHVKAEVDLQIFSRWDRVFAGDLHSHSNSQLNIVYPGSPVTTSFHRNNVDTGVIILDSNTTDYEWVKLEVPQLIRKTINAGEEMLPTEYDHTIYEVVGNIEELGNMENSDLIDKKLVKRSTECALVLDSKMSVLEELNEYLAYIVQLPESTIEDILKEFNDSSKGT
jgi:DNA repair exonuclease SbcCD nuclease subunit